MKRLTMATYKAKEKLESEWSFIPGLNKTCSILQQRQMEGKTLLPEDQRELRDAHEDGFLF